MVEEGIYILQYFRSFLSQSVPFKTFYKIKLNGKSYLFVEIYLQWLCHSNIFFKEIFLGRWVEFFSEDFTLLSGEGSLSSILLFWDKNSLIFL